MLRHRSSSLLASFSRGLCLRARSCPSLRASKTEPLSLSSPPSFSLLRRYTTLLPRPSQQALERAMIRLRPAAHLSQLPSHEEAEGKNGVITPVKSAEDERSYRIITLSNQLQCILVSDPKAEKSGAGMDVYVGHFSDPAYAPGLAHFCEHMLFLGTEKYPDENSYTAFLQSHGGRSNAFTSMQHTNYFFDVAPGHLEEALDRFAQFFIAPLFTSSATEREMKAVDSENAKNLQVDSRRSFQLMKSLSNPSHPFHKFGTGNLQTLRDEPLKQEVDIRQELLDFHEKYYSANTMKLCVLGRESLDQLQEWAETKFTSVLNRNISVPSFKHQGEPFQPCLGKRYQVVPVKDLRYLNMSWPMPIIADHYRSRPSSGISHLLGHEGPGSVLSLLKSLGWANGLSAGQTFNSTEISSFGVTVDLTEDGLSKVDEIVTIIYQYMQLVREMSDEEWQRFYQEAYDISQLNFRFKGKEQTQNYVSSLAQSLQTHLPQDALCANYYFPQLNLALTRHLVDHIRPSNCYLTVVSKAFEGQTDSEERWYGVKYAQKDLDQELLSSWSSPSLHPSLSLPCPNPYIATDFSLHYTREHQEAWLSEQSKEEKMSKQVVYEDVPIHPSHEVSPPTVESSVHSSLHQISSAPLPHEGAKKAEVSPKQDEEEGEGGVEEEVERVMDGVKEEKEEKGEGEKAVTDVDVLPTSLSSSSSASSSVSASSSITITTTTTTITFDSSPPSLLLSHPHLNLWYQADRRFFKPRLSVCAMLYAPLARVTPTHSVLNILWPMLLEDDLNEETYDASTAGLSFSISGVNQGLSVSFGGYNDKLPVLADKVMTRIGSYQVDETRFNMLKESLSRALKNSQADQPYQVAGVNESLCLDDHAWHSLELLQALNGVSVSDVQNYANQFLKRGFVEMLVYGNASEQQAKELAHVVGQPLHFSASPLLPSEKLLALDARTHILQPNTRYVYEQTHPQLSEKNAAVKNTYQIGPDNRELRIRALVFAHMAREPCFSQLRTREQLGYLVWSGVSPSNGVLSFWIMLQSSVQGGKYLDDRAEAFLETMNHIITDMSEEQFQLQLAAVMHERQKKPESMNAQLSAYWHEVTRQRYQFDLKDKDVEAMRSLTKQDILDFYHQYIRVNAPERRKLTNLLNPQAKIEHKESEAKKDEGSTAETPLPPVPHDSAPCVVVQNPSELKARLPKWPNFWRFADCEHDYFKL